MMPRPVALLATLTGMLAAYIWHWWIGLIMLLAGVLVAVGLIGGYLKQVSAQRYPNGRRAREQEL
jgi:membrane protein implicated in regulation of membrane protease activity